MPILRRYLRVSKYTALEVRIFLGAPSDQSWFRRTNAEPRLMRAVKPVVGRLLAERSGSGGGNVEKGGKEAVRREEVAAEDFEVAVYFTGVGMRHTIMKRTQVAVVEEEPVVLEEEDDDEEEPLFLPAPTRGGDDAGDGHDDADDADDTDPEERKKPRLRAEYEGFNIYDRVLCLAVTRTGQQQQQQQQQERGLMEGWIAMSQAVHHGGEDAADG